MWHNAMSSLYWRGISSWHGTQPRNHNADVALPPGRLADVVSATCHHDWHGIDHMAGQLFIIDWYMSPSGGRHVSLVIGRHVAVVGGWYVSLIVWHVASCLGCMWPHHDAPRCLATMRHLSMSRRATWHYLVATCGVPKWLGWSSWDWVWIGPRFWAEQ